MDTITSKLKRKLGDNLSSSKTLKDTLSRLVGLEESSAQIWDGRAWDAIRNDFQALHAEGAWNEAELEENLRLLSDLRVSASNRPSRGSSRASVESTEGDRISIVEPPSIRLPSTIPNVFAQNSVILPLELVDALNHAYSLHVLATDPAKVLPPGKSILSMMSRPRTQSEHGEDSLPKLQAKVEGLAHQAFWDAATESLADPEPSVQLSRLKLLYKDIHTALVPLLPSAHHVLVTLSSQLSPTSSPLRSALIHLREVLSSLRERCAPARDAHIDALVQGLQEPPTALPDPSAMAKLFTSTTESILKFSEVMKDDLSQFVLGTMSEKQLRALIVQQAKRDERRTVEQICPLERTQHLWVRWLSEQSQEGAPSVSSNKWILRLMQALGSTLPISSNLPALMASSSDPADNSDNSLPPPFLFSAPELLYIQNFLQAVVIAASLRSLARLPTPVSPPIRSNNPQPDIQRGSGDFMDRVWTLLRAEIDEEEGSGDTKVVNLADEVLRAQRQAMASQSMATDSAEETRLRAAVGRTLQPSDPVFSLLQKRLLTALATRLSQLNSIDRSDFEASRMVAPEFMQTGLDRGRVGKRPMLMLDSHELGLGRAQSPGRPYIQEPLRVKGFEDPVLVKVMGEALGRLIETIEWVRSVWKDIIDRGELQDGLG